MYKGRIKMNFTKIQTEVVDMKNMFSNIKSTLTLDVKPYETKEEIIDLLKYYWRCEKGKLVYPYGETEEEEETCIKNAELNLHLLTDILRFVLGMGYNDCYDYLSTEYERGIEEAIKDIKG